VATGRSALDRRRTGTTRIVVRRQHYRDDIGILTSLINGAITVVVEAIAHLSEAWMYPPVVIVTVTLLLGEAIAVEITLTLVDLTVTVVIDTLEDLVGFRMDCGIFVVAVPLLF
jgi:hypothetical protein